LLKAIGATGAAGLAGCTEDSGGGGGGNGNGGGNGSGGGGGNGSGGDNGQILLETAGGSPGGVGYAIMNALFSSASAAYPQIAYNILPGGWVGNNTRLQNQEIGMGHTTLAAATLAKTGKDPYNDKGWENPPSHLRSVLADQSEIFFFAVAQPEFQYDTLAAAAEDDYKISVTNQPKGTFGGFLWDTVLSELNYGQQQIQQLGGSYRRVDWNDAAQLFSDNQVDVILTVGGRDLGWLSGVAANQNVKYLGFRDEFRTQIKETYGVLKTDLEGVFPKQDGTLNCLQDSGLVNTHDGVSENAVYKVTKGIIEKEEQIKESTGLLAPFKADRNMATTPLPLHPGAVKAYEEADITVPEQ
jgi:TRAP transporter TAXI family solute receptor